MHHLAASAGVAIACAACGPAPAPGPAPAMPHDRGAALQGPRPDSKDYKGLFAFAPGDVVETFGSAGGKFLVHFARQGPNAVPAADGDASGVPDFVEEVAATYEKVLARYAGDLGFRAPVSDEKVSGGNGGDGRFDVYLVDFGGKGDGNFAQDGCVPGKPEVCIGYMIQENDFAGYGYPSTQQANRILASHEFFHAVQAAYDAGQGSVMAEGTAVWATEKFDPTLSDLEGFSAGYLDNPDRSLDEPMPGPADPFSYGAGVFFQFLDERYKGTILRSLWERLENGANGVADPKWMEALDPTVAAAGGGSFADMFVEHATWNLFTGKHADPKRAYANGAAYKRVRVDEVELPYQKDKLRVFHASTQYFGAPLEGRAEMGAALVAPAEYPDALDHVALLVAVERAGKYDAVVRVTDTGAGTQSVDAAGADRAVVAVVNTESAGASRRPGLCIGSAAEVQACRVALGAAPPAGDAGAPDAAPDAADAPPAAPPAESPASSPSGCSCRAGRTPARATSDAPIGTAAAAIVIAARALRRRRRRLGE